VSMGPHIEFVRQGKLRILVAATSRRARRMCPTCRPFAEAGIFPASRPRPGSRCSPPRGTPKEIVDQLNGYVRDLAQDADARKRLEANFHRSRRDDRRRIRRSGEGRRGEMGTRRARSRRQGRLIHRCAPTKYSTCVPGAAQRLFFAVRCRPGTVPSAECGRSPDQRCITRAPRKRRLVLHRIRDNTRLICIFQS